MIFDCSDKPKYASREFYKLMFADYLADVGEDYHNSDNLLLGLLDAAAEWFEYHDTSAKRYKEFIAKVEGLASE